MQSADRPDSATLTLAFAIVPPLAERITAATDAASAAIVPLPFRSAGLC